MPARAKSGAAALAGGTRHDVAGAAHTDELLAAAREGDRTHTQVQGWLRDLGLAEVLLSAGEMAQVIEKFKGYGMRSAKDNVAKIYGELKK